MCLTLYFNHFSIKINLCPLILKSNCLYYIFFINDKMNNIWFGPASQPWADCHLSLLLYVSVLRERREITGERPPDLSGSCGSYVNGTFYVFAGCDNRLFTNEVLLKDLPFCRVKVPRWWFLSLSVDVQLCPHTAALHVEESDWHQGNNAIATEQSLLLGTQRQVNLHLHQAHHSFVI